MPSKLVPDDPSKVMVIRDIVPNVITTFSTPFLRFGLIKVGGRGTVVRLQSGALAVFSPTALTPEVKEKVAQLGEVKYITAPDMEHHIFVGPWHKEYPNAKVIGPEGLREKRAKDKKEDMPITELTAKDSHNTHIDPEFDAEFDVEYVPSHLNKEIVFNHRPTGTLIQADYLWNLPATEQMSKTGDSATSGIFTKIWTGITSTKGQALGQRRFLWYGPGSSDRPNFAKSAQIVDSWKFDRIIPCHGDVIETGGHAVFQKVFQWHLQGHK